MNVILSEAKDLSNLMKAFYVYMMTNRIRVVLYTGIINSLMRRVSQHQNGQIKGFTKAYKVNRLVYYERFDDPRDAIAREKKIKRMATREKECLGRHDKPEMGGSVTNAFSAYTSRLDEMTDPHKMRAFRSGRSVIKRPAERSLAPLGMTDLRT